MAADISKWGDHAQLLAQHAGGIASALCAFKHVLDLESRSPTDIVFRGGLPDAALAYAGTPFPLETSARPPLDRLPLFLDPAIVGLHKQLLKKFPDYGDLGKNVASFQNGFADILESNGSQYQLLVAVAEYLEISVPVLQMAGRFSRLNYEINPDIVNALLDLFIGIATIIYLVGSIVNDAKLVAFAYNRAYQFSSGGADSPDWPRVAKFLTTHEKPNMALQEAVSPISHRIITILITLRHDIETRVMSTPEMFRNTGAFALIPDLHNIKTASLSEGQLCTLGNPLRIFKAFVFGVLAAPVEAFQQTASLDVLKVVCGYGYVLPLYRNETISLMTEFEAVSKTNPKASKLKSIVNDAISGNQATIHQFHRERRAYLAQQLRQMLSLARDDRLLGNKFTTIAAILSLSRDEIQWYFAHYEREGKKKKEAKPIDLVIIELMYFVREFIVLIQDRRHVIQEAVSRQFTMSGIPRDVQTNIEKLQQERVNGRESSGVLIQAIYSNLLRVQETDAMELGQLGELSAMRANSIRFQVVSSTGNESTHTMLVSNICQLLSEYCNTSLWIDSFDQRVSDLYPFKHLFFSQSVLYDHIKECMDLHHESIRYVGVMGHIAATFSSNVTDIWPVEFDWISAHTMCYATEVYSALGQYAASVAHDLALSMAAIQVRARAEGAVAFLPKLGQNTSESKRKTAVVLKKIAIDKQALPIRPGQESTLKGTDMDTQFIERLKQTLKNVLMALSKPVCINIHEVEFQPIEFFVDALMVKFRSYLNQVVYRVETPTKDSQANTSDDVMSFDVKRPSMLLHEIRSYLQTAKYMDQIGGTDTVAVLRDILIEQADIEKARGCTTESTESGGSLVSGTGTIPRKPNIRDRGKPAAINITQPFLVTYAQWYCEFVTTRATSGTTVYSRNRHAFCNIYASSAESEMYTEPRELTALCHLVGPQGVQFIDIKLTRQITVFAGSVLDMIHQNYEALDRVRSHWTDAIVMKDTLRKMKFLPEFITRMVTAGFILEFRQLLSEAAKQVVSRTYPHVEKLVDVAYRHYHATAPNGSEDLRLLDNLATQLGLRNRTDVMLQWALSALTVNQTDTGPWALLPHLFASAMWYMVYDDRAVYNPHFDAVHYNGHCILSMFTALARYVLPSTTAAAAAASGSSSTSSTTRVVYREFHRVVSGLLLGTPPRAPEKDRDWQPRAYDVVVGIVQRFADTACINGILHVDDVEAVYPRAAAQVANAMNFCSRISAQPNAAIVPLSRGDEDGAF